MAPASINNQDRRALCARTARRADATPRAQFRRRRDRPSLAWHRHLADGTWAGSPCHSNILPLLRRRNGYRSVDRKSASSTSTSPPTAASHWFRASRSEEHTSELQSQSNLVCRLLLEKKKAHIAEAEDTPSGRDADEADVPRSPVAHPLGDAALHLPADVHAAVPTADVSQSEAGNANP